MVFHEIESIIDLLSGHRIIIYYIEDGSESELKLRNSVESVMEMLEKKNDDLIIIKVSKNTHLFNQFKELYKPMITGPVALFVINSEGIPLICEQIFKDENIFQAFNSVCTYCKLNFISQGEITKAIDTTKPAIIMNGLEHEPSHQASKTSALGLCESDISVLDCGAGTSKDRPSQDTAQSSTSTELQIRLPDGTKEKQKFGKYAFLQEVYDFIHTKFNLNNFDLKTYNHTVFSAADYESTLQDLYLTPNGVVIVIHKNVVPFNSKNSISNMIQSGFWIVFGKVSPVLKYVQGLLYAFWSTFFSSGNTVSRQIRNQTEGSSSSSNKAASSGTKKSSSKFGNNIHTLRRSDDSDDENNRYNGNSTQQK